MPCKAGGTFWSLPWLYGAFGKDRVLALGCLCLRSKEGHSQALELQHPPLRLLIVHIPWSGEEGPWALGPDPLTAE